uniref:Uncharacterized protein n=1 Tax=Rhizophora mucronata TaxID=61149 RepID=A0A2P2PEC2_RHIMU
MTHEFYSVQSLFKSINTEKRKKLTSEKFHNNPDLTLTCNKAKAATPKMNKKK